MVTTTVTGVGAPIPRSPGSKISTVTDTVGFGGPMAAAVVSPVARGVGDNESPQATSDTARRIDRPERSGASILPNFMGITVRRLLSTRSQRCCKASVEPHSEVPIYHTLGIVRYRSDRVIGVEPLPTADPALAARYASGDRLLIATTGARRQIYG